MEINIVQILLGCITVLLGIIAWGGKWGIKKVCESIEGKVDKEDCSKVHKAAEKENGELWDRINHHTHNGGGKVVIP
jgi:hypothetical protein